MRTLLHARFPFPFAFSRDALLSSPTSLPPTHLHFSATMNPTPDTIHPPSPLEHLHHASNDVTKESPIDPNNILVQYIVLRRDLIDSWPLGSTVSQGCHAAVAAIWTHRDHPDTAAYCAPANIDAMHKVTLEVKGETQMRNLCEKLEAAGIEHKMWIEQPENVPTCVATRPYPRSQVASFFKKLKLCK